MQQRLTFITIGVDDLEASKKFYIEKFGWKPIKDDQGIVFFKLNGIIFSLYPREELAKDAKVESKKIEFKNFTLSINFSSREEVDKAFAEMKEKGVKIIKPAEEVFWGGYSGYVSDNDGNLWEFAHNPFQPMDENGNVV